MTSFLQRDPPLPAFILTCRARFNLLAMTYDFRRSIKRFGHVRRIECRSEIRSDVSDGNISAALSRFALFSRRVNFYFTPSLLPAMYHLFALPFPVLSRSPRILFLYVIISIRGFPLPLLSIPFLLFTRKKIDLFVTYQFCISSLRLRLSR